VSSRSPSPQPKRRLDSPPDQRSRHTTSPPTRPGGERVYESDSDGSRHSTPHRDLSPPRNASRRFGSARDSPVSSRGFGRSEHSRSRSRSPPRRRSRSRSPYQESNRRYRERDDGKVARTHESQPPQASGAPRERSLSPFSKRLALTQAMNMGR
jgi:hypothetical protein